MEIAYLVPDFQDGSASLYGRLDLILVPVVVMKLLLCGADCVVCTTKETACSRPHTRGPDTRLSVAILAHTSGMYVLLLLSGF